MTKNKVRGAIISLMMFILPFIGLVLFVFSAIMVHFTVSETVYSVLRCTCIIGVLMMGSPFFLFILMCIEEVVRLAIPRDTKQVAANIYDEEIDGIDGEDQEICEMKEKIINDLNYVLGEIKKLF